MEGVLSRLGALARHSDGGSREADRGEVSGREVVGTRLEARHVRAWRDAIGTTGAAHGQALADAHVLTTDVAHAPQCHKCKGDGDMASCA